MYLERQVHVKSMVRTCRVLVLQGRCIVHVTEVEGLVSPESRNGWHDLVDSAGETITDLAC